MDSVEATTSFASGAKESGSFRWNMDLKTGEYVFQIEAIDIYGFLYRETETMVVGLSANLDG